MTNKKNTLISAFACLAFVLIYACSATAEWRIEIDSIEVQAGATGVQLGIKAFWDRDLAGISVPVVVRAITPGAFWTGTLPSDTGGNGFMHPSAQGVKWSWAKPWATLLEELRPASDRIGVVDPCPRGKEINTSYDGISPDNFVINAAGTGLAATAAPAGHTFITLTFDVTGTAGKFVFDTACYSAAIESIFMIDNNFPPKDHGTGKSSTKETTFRRGVVVIKSRTK